MRRASEPRLTRWLKHRYERGLGLAFRYRRTVIAVSRWRRSWRRWSASSAAGRSFLPEFNEGALTVSAVTVPGTSLADADALGNALERLMLSVPEVTSTARRTGRAELDEHVQGVESAEIDVRLAMKDRPREAVLEELRQKVSLLPGTNVTIGQPISHRIDHMLSGTRANIAVKIFGDDLPVLRQLAATVQAEMAQVPGVVDLSTEAQADIPTLKVRVDAAAAARQGLDTGAVTEALQTARVGQVGRPDPRRAGSGAAGGPLCDRSDDGSRIRREHADPDTGSAADPAGVGHHDPAGPRPELRHARERAAPHRGAEQRVGPRPAECRERHPGARGGERGLPAGYHVEYGGQFESEAQASRQLLWLSAGVIVAIFLILTSAFGSTRDGLLIMLNLPLALIGGVVGVYLAGGVLSVASIVGFITLFGIATRNGIMLVSHIR